MRVCKDAKCKSSMVIMSKLTCQRTAEQGHYLEMWVQIPKEKAKEVKALASEDRTGEQGFLCLFICFCSCSKCFSTIESENKNK